MVRDLGHVQFGFFRYPVLDLDSVRLAQVFGPVAVGADVDKGVVAGVHAVVLLDSTVRPLHDLNRLGLNNLSDFFCEANEVPNAGH